MATEWFTQPDRKDQKYASYYYYDTEKNHTLVRIRLELGRLATGGDDGQPCIIVRPNRCVGFSNVDYHTAERNAMTCREDFRIVYEGGLLSNKETVGYNVYDFTKPDPGHKSTPHKGNKVVNSSDAYLPKSITADMLRTAALKHINDGRADIKINSDYTKSIGTIKEQE